MKTLARALHAGVQLTPPSRASNRFRPPSTFLRAHCMPMLHYMKYLIQLISSHTDTMEWLNSINKIVSSNLKLYQV